LFCLAFEILKASQYIIYITFHANTNVIDL